MVTAQQSQPDRKNHDSRNERLFLARMKRERYSMAGEWIKRVEKEYGQDIYEILTMEAKTAKEAGKTKAMLADELGITKFELIYALRKFGIKLRQVISEEALKARSERIRSSPNTRMYTVKGERLSRSQALRKYRRGSQTIDRIMRESGASFEEALFMPGISEDERIKRSIRKRWGGRKSKRSSEFNPAIF